MKSLYRLSHLDLVLRPFEFRSAHRCFVKWWRGDETCLERSTLLRGSKIKMKVGEEKFCPRERNGGS